jgi:starch synthase
VRVVLPYYKRVYDGGHEVVPAIPALKAPIGRNGVSFETLQGRLPGTDVPVYFVHCPSLYGRDGIYTQDADEAQRFALLNWAGLRIAQQLGFAPDIVHVNDWQTSLVPLMLKTVFAWDRLFKDTRTVLTLHNVGHQGTFGAEKLPELGLADVAGSFHQEHLREGRLSFMLTGILYANAITTVSPTYAREIQTPEHGVGLDGFLRARGDVLRGILNGIDDEEWSPSSDKHIPFAYSADDLAGKEKNKKFLCHQMGLPYRPGVPLVGIVSRLAWQKGFDLCFDALPAMLTQRDVQLVVLGSGEPRYEALFSRLARIAPHKVGFKRGFSEPLAHLIEAGSDMFLMPSRFEPCGLNQMYSFAYGTPPIVHRTGGLADTVRQWRPHSGEGNGFSFDHFDVAGLKWALGTALDAFRDRASWRRLMLNGMKEELGWGRRVREYERLYDALVG